jgi:Fe-S-cluster containining protein
MSRPPACNSKINRRNSVNHIDDPEFESDIAATAAKLGQSRTAADVATIMDRVTGRAEATVEASLTPEDRKAIACRAGCSTCCAVNVAVLLSEAVAIAVYLAASIPPDVLPRLKATLGDTTGKVRWMEDDERRRLGIPCSLLDTRGYCVIHPVRPLLCRSITSTDPRLCREAMDSWEDEPAPVIMNLGQKFLFDKAFCTLGETLERLGLESRSYELNRAVWNCLIDPELAARFLAGEKVSLP